MVVKSLPFSFSEFIQYLKLISEGGYLLQRVKKVNTMKEGQEVIMEKLNNGEALEKFRQMLIGQGVKESVANELCLKRNYNVVFETKAKFLSTIRAKQSGKKKLF